MANRSALYNTIFFCNIVFTVLASWLFSVPGGWKMFTKVSAYDLSLYDKDNHYIQVHDYLPRPTYILEAKTFFKIASHICHLNESKGPYLIKDNISKKTIQSKRCEF